MDDSFDPAENPFRPGAGHPPPYLAGRNVEKDEFSRLLRQRPVLKNLVLTGLRGVGKTVLLGELQPRAAAAGWLWVGDDLSEVASLTEENLVTRLLTDLATVTSPVVIDRQVVPDFGFSKNAKVSELHLTFDVMQRKYAVTPGLASDKLKSVLELVWACLKKTKSVSGVILAYDEAQNLSEHADRDQYPVSLLLDVFQSLQKKQIPMMLVLSGLPTLYPTLVNARTFAERMFQVTFLDRLDDKASREAITRPIDKQRGPFTPTAKLVNEIIRESGGYPYFLQYLCREVFDIALQRRITGRSLKIDLNDITRKLDMDFFAGRWGRLTERQRDLMTSIAYAPGADEEFSVQQIVAQSQMIPGMQAFSASHANQMLAKLSSSGLVYKNRHGKYSFAIPLLGKFIRRQVQLPA